MAEEKIEPPLLPILVKRDDIITIKQAAFEVGKSTKTIRRWFKEYRLGRQVSQNAPIEISFPGVQMVAHGDFETLEILRSGDRSHPAVSRYFDLCGIPI